MCQKRDFVLPKLPVAVALLLLVLSDDHIVSGRDLVEQTSMLDGVFIRSLFHSFRDFTFRLVGSTGRKTRGSFLQDMHKKFPCDLTEANSRTVPDSVHRLRPGKFLLYAFKYFY